jgi:hypothetical protein
MNKVRQKVVKKKARVREDSETAGFVAFFWLLRG